jgi:hypothetical protein
MERESRRRSGQRGVSIDVRRLWQAIRRIIRRKSNERTK